jgi:DNA ligase-1
MHSESGQLDGKKIKSEDTIREGKNIGKANETTPEEQALIEAEARWVAKTKKGYTTTEAGAATGKVEDIIEGGYNPMLAKSFDELEFPFAVQPKLDGIRCCVTETSTWTRTRKPIRSVPHINHALSQLKNAYDQLDGELYNHAFHDNFEKITHIVNQKKEIDPEHGLVEYHVYDMPSNKPFKERLLDLQELIKKLPKKSPIKLVETRIVKDEVELAQAFDDFRFQGYEGLMARPLDGAYEYKRSSNLLKLKEFEDAEFQIIGGEEGRGKLQGHLGAFICRKEDGTEFKVKMSGETSKLKDYWENLNKYVGEMLTVKFQGLTGKNKVPRFPVGKAIRDYE